MAFGARKDWVSWCIPAGRISGVEVGIHWSFPLFILLYASQAWSNSGGEWALVTLTALMLLYGIVLCHEFGHVFAGRREGVESDRVMLWPLGGLAFLGEERMGMAEVRIAAAGPAVNVLFAIALLPVLAITGVEIRLSLLNPFDWSAYAREPSFVSDVMYVLYKVNVLSIYFNLIPAFPLDGGRILRGFLYLRHGLVKSILLTTSVSFVLVGVFVIWAVVKGDFTLVFIAAFLAITAWQVRRQVQGFGAGSQPQNEIPGYDFSMGNTSLARTEDRAARAQRKKDLRARKKARRKAREEREIEEQIDSLLDKISQHGIASLSKQEKTFLEKASRRKR